MVPNFWIGQADILTYEIDIPWFELPYSTKVLGTPSCRRDSTNVQYTKRSGGYCKPNTADSDLCRGSSKSHAHSGTCSGASSDGYLQSTCNLSCAKDRCAKDPLCTVRRRDWPVKMDSLLSYSCCLDRDRDSLGSLSAEGQNSKLALSRVVFIQTRSTTATPRRIHT